MERNSDRSEISTTVQVTVSDSSCVLHVKARLLACAHANNDSKIQ